MAVDSSRLKIYLRGERVHQAAGTDDQPNNQHDDNDNSDDDLAVDNNGALDDADTFSLESPGNDSIEDVTSEKWDDENAIEAEDDCDEAEDGCAGNQGEEAEDVCGDVQGEEAEDGCEKNQGEESGNGCALNQGEKAENIHGKSMATECGVGGVEEDVEDARGDNSNTDDHDEYLNLTSLFGDISLK